MNTETTKPKASGQAVACSALLADSPTWPHVLAFAERMEAKLAMNRHKGDRAGWINDDPWSLWRRIGDEHTELMTAMENGSTAEQIANEAADTANFCMMVADWFTERAKSANKAASEIEALRRDYQDARNLWNVDDTSPHNHFIDVMQDCMNKEHSLRARVAELEKAYNELIMAVARKFPDEARHQTALRYIMEVENNAASGNNAAMSAEKKP